MRTIDAIMTATFILVFAACETTILPPGIEASAPAPVLETAPPTAEVNEAGPTTPRPDIVAIGPSCTLDEECLEDDACPGVGGCDGDPCRDDRCLSGQCIYTGIEDCDPGYMIEYGYASCCARRTLVLAPDGRCTFQVEGGASQRCTDIAPSYLRNLVNRAYVLGFFDWGLGHCVPGATAADFDLYMRAGSYDNWLYCEGVCVGELCSILDGVWALMPPNWQDGCGCE